MKDPSPFISAFTKALSEEMAAMRSNLGTHELPLGPLKNSPTLGRVEATASQLPKIGEESK